MDATNLILDTLDAFTKMYSAFCRKSYVAVKVQLVPSKDKSNPAAKELVALTIINESGPDIEVEEAWFLTSFNRRILTTYIDSKMPEKVLSKDRAIYFIPLEELKAALNKSIGETITQAAIFDKGAQRVHAGRVDKAAELEFAR